MYLSDLMDHPSVKFLLSQSPEIRDVIEYLRHFIPTIHEDITEEWKFNTFFFCYKGRMMCYIGVLKRGPVLYLGFIDGPKMKSHPKLISGGRKVIKILELDVSEDIDIVLIKSFVKDSIRVKEENPKKQKKTNAHGSRATQRKH